MCTIQDKKALIKIEKHTKVIPQGNDCGLREAKIIHS